MELYDLPADKKHPHCGQPYCKNCGNCSWCICRCDKAPRVIFHESRAFWRDMIRIN